VQADSDAGRGRLSFEEAVNGMLRLACCALAALFSVNGQRISSSGQPLPFIADQEAAQRAESELADHPDNLELAGQLLDFYDRNWQQANLRPARLRLILWTITNHPDIRLAGRHDPRGLLVNPDDKQDYARVRAAWLDQIARRAGNAQVLVNAARCLRLTDRETAANWLKQAIKLDSAGAGFLVSDLGDVYAAAICGISGMNPWEGPTSFDLAETHSDFVRRAKEEAGREAELAARTGWAVYLCSEALGAAHLSSTDYDPIAEQLLIQAASLDYPNPARQPFLGTFYSRQERKSSGRLAPRWRIVEVTPEEQAKRVVEKPKKIGFTDPNFHSAVVLPVKIVIGIDGHVWKAEALNPSELAAGVAAGSALDWTYTPLRLNGEPVQVSTVVPVTIEPLVTRSPL
jgi:TPR repeat protein